MALLFGLNLREKSLFFRQVATMVGSAISISRAVNTAGSVSFPSLSKEMGDLVDQGYPLSQVLARYPHYFSDYEVAAVKTGEMAGSLDDQLDILAQDLEKSYELRQSLMSKCLYPVLVGHAAVFIPPLAVLVTQGVNAYLRMTLGLLIPVYVISFMLFAFYRLSSQSSGFRGSVDSVIAFIPIIGGAVRLLAITRFLRVLAHLHEAGMLPDKALAISYATCGNAYVSSCIAGSFKRMGDSVPTSKVLAASGMFPHLVPTMLATGEETGQTSRMLNKAADLTEQDMRAAMHRIVTVLPIVMLLAMGVVVGYNVISVFTGFAKMINI